MTCVSQCTLDRVHVQEKDDGKLSQFVSGMHHFSSPEISIVTSPNKMRFSDSVTSDFDISAILSRVSGRESNDTSMVNDGLFSILDKISTTGQQLKDELQNAKIREDSLVREMHQLKSKGNESLLLSPTNMSPCACRNSELVPQSRDEMDNTEQKCEKLQNALLSLEEENMRLNRLLKKSEVPPLSVRDGGSTITEQILKSREKEVEALRVEVGELRARLDEARQDLTVEKQKRTDLQKHANSQVSIALNTSISEDQFLLLQQKANSLKKENDKYLGRIQKLESKLKLTLEAASTEETYKLRIDDMHNLLVTKEDEIGKLKERLLCATKDLAEKDNKAKELQRKDICKRKEVLLFCEKYEQLKKRVKRLECDFRDSQQKLQESNTKCWALETSFQRTVEENEVLKHQLGLLEGFVRSVKTSKSTNAASSLVKDYERLTGKYEELLSLRLREYEKLKSSSKNKKMLKKITEHYSADEYEKRKHVRKALFNDAGHRDEMLEELMWKRERDLRRFNAQVDIPTIRSSSAHEFETPRQLYDVPSVKEFENGFTTAISSHRQVTPRDIDSYLSISRNAASLPAWNQDTKRPHTEYYNPKDTDTEAGPDMIGVSFRTDRMTSTPVKKRSPSPYLSEEAILPEPPFPRQSHDAARSRSRSFSPVRSPVAGLHNKSVNDSQNSNSHDFQKSVSFRLAPMTPRRSKSACALDIGRKALDVTPRGSMVSAGPKKVVSPVEVLERVKSAYQEEYVRNMKGVDIAFSPSNTKEGDLKAPGVSSYGDRYKNINQNLKNFMEQNCISSRPLRPPRELHSTQKSRPKLPSPKGILKKPRSVDEDPIIQSPSLPPEIQKASVVVREKNPSHALEYNNCLSGGYYSTDRQHGHSPIEIIDVNPTSIDGNGNSVSVNSSRGSFNSNVDVAENKNGAKSKKSDLTAPIQFTKSLKEDEDESDSASQSSLMSTKDHIGRFEFLQEMRSSLKKPSFAYQKPVEKQPSEEETSAATDKNNSGELGLSARQQEYADKLVQKYTKRS